MHSVVRGACVRIVLAFGLCAALPSAAAAQTVAPACPCEPAALGFFAAARAGDFTRATGFFAPDLKKALRADDVAGYWERLVRAHGAPLAARLGWIERGPEFTSAHLDCEFERATVVMKLAFRSRTPMAEMVGIFGLEGQALVLPAAQAARQVELATGIVLALQLSNWVGAAKDFGPDMARGLPPARLRDTWNAVLAQTGPFQKITATRVEKMPDVTLVTLTCAFARASWLVRVGVAQGTNRVTALFFAPADGPGAP